jgi:hypothetical protein
VCSSAVIQSAMPKVPSSHPAEVQRRMDLRGTSINNSVQSAQRTQGNGLEKSVTRPSVARDLRWAGATRLVSGDASPRSPSPKEGCETRRRHPSVIAEVACRDDLLCAHARACGGLGGDDGLGSMRPTFPILNQHFGNTVQQYKNNAK